MKIPSRYIEQVRWNFVLRPPWMAEVLEMQEQFPAIFPIKSFPLISNQF